MRIAVASGKGGTGKTLVATNLAWLLAGAGHRVIYVDADVEAPSGGVFFGNEPSGEASREAAKGARERLFTVPIPALLADSCSGCAECQAACAFHAIVALKHGVMILPELCHGCGACFIACPSSSLQEVRRSAGTIRSANSGKLAHWSAELRVNEARAAPLVRGLLDAVEAEHEDGTLVVIDGPPGTSCPVVEAVRTADLVLLVAEPTPFGLHDLELALELCEILGRPRAALINRCDVGDGRTRAFLEELRVPILAEIPFSRAIASACAAGELAVRWDLSFRDTIERLADSVLQRARR